MTPFYSDEWLTLYGGDCRAVLSELPADSVDCVVTSPPYWGLRDYGTATWSSEDIDDETVGREFIKRHWEKSTEELRAELEAEAADHDHSFQPDAGATSQRVGRSYQQGHPHRRCSCGATRIDSQLGLERTPEEYVANLVAVFAEVRRVLKPSGTCWLNLGDSYAGGGTMGRNDQGRRVSDGEMRDHWKSTPNMGTRPAAPNLKPKDLVGIPWMVAKALQEPYYIGNIKDEADRAWLAGWLDGEGTISFVERNRGANHTSTHDVRVFITNTDRAPLDHFAAMCGGRVYRTEDGTRENRYGSRPCFRWQMGTHDGAMLLRELYPYLRTKRRQAALVWTLYTTLRHKNGHARTPEAVVARRHEIAIRVRRLNAGDDVNLPAWVEEPPSPTEPGWYLRSDIIWAKPNPMPESVTDRPTKAHEYLFLLTKSARYYFDADAVREDGAGRLDRGKAARGRFGEQGWRQEPLSDPAGRNIRSVWTIATRPYPGAHFAVFPPELPERCIKAGSPENGVVLDPFAGSGTVGMVANRLSRRAVLIDLNPEYLKQQMRRNAQTPLGLAG